MKKFIVKRGNEIVFRAVFAADSEAALTVHGLTLTETEGELMECLRPLLTLPAGALLSRLLEDGPDDAQHW